MNDILKEKILLLLATGITFGFSYTPSMKWKVIKNLSKEWEKINKKDLSRKIAYLSRSKLICKKKNLDGSFTLLLTDKGRMEALNYNFQKINKNNWDGKWRMVIFDIPEELKKGRDALRWKLRSLGFCEFQKSVFATPYECKKEIDFMVNFFGLKKYVRYAVVESIDDSLHLKKFFDLV